MTEIGDPRIRNLDGGDPEPTKEDILEDIRIGIQQAQAGEGRPAREALDEIRRDCDEEEQGDRQ